MDKQIRMMDDLGRIVIPKSIRELLYHGNDDKCYGRDFEIGTYGSYIILKRIEKEEIDE